MNNPIFSQGFDGGRKEFLRDNDLVHFGMHYVKDCEFRATEQLKHLRAKCDNVEWIDTAFNNLVAQGQHPPGVDFFKEVEFLYNCKGPLMTLADRMIEYRMAERFFGGKDGQIFKNDKSSGRHAAQIYLWLEFKRTASALGHVDDSSKGKEGGGFARSSNEDEGEGSAPSSNQDGGNPAPPDEGSDTSSDEDEDNPTPPDAYPAASVSIQVVSDESSSDKGNTPTPGVDSTASESIQVVSAKSSSKTGALPTPESDYDLLAKVYQEKIKSQTVEINKEKSKFDEWYAKLFADLKTAMETYSAIKKDDTFAGKEIIEILRELTLAYFDDMRDTWIRIEDAAPGHKLREKLSEFKLTLLPNPDFEVEWDGKQFFKLVPGKRKPKKEYKELKDVFKSLWNSIDWRSFEFVNKTSELTRKLTAYVFMNGMHEILNGKGSTLDTKDERKSIHVSISYFWLKVLLSTILDFQKKKVENLTDLSERDFIFNLIGMFWETPVRDIMTAAERNLNGPYFEDKDYRIAESTALYTVVLGCNAWIFQVIPIAIEHGFEEEGEHQLTVEVYNLITRWVTSVLKQNENKPGIQHLIKKAAVLYTNPNRDYEALAKNSAEFVRCFRTPLVTPNTEV